MYIYCHATASTLLTEDLRLSGESQEDVDLTACDAEVSNPTPYIENFQMENKEKKSITSVQGSNVGLFFPQALPVGATAVPSRPLQDVVLGIRNRERPSGESQSLKCIRINHLKTFERVGNCPRGSGNDFTEDRSRLALQANSMLNNSSRKLMLHRPCMQT